MLATAPTRHTTAGNISPCAPAFGQFVSPTRRRRCPCCCAVWRISRPHRVAGAGTNPRPAARRRCKLHWRPCRRETGSTLIHSSECTDAAAQRPRRSAPKAHGPSPSVRRRGREQIAPGEACAPSWASTPTDPRERRGPARIFRRGIKNVTRHR